MYRIVFTGKANKDKPLLAAAGLEAKAKALLALIAQNPYTNPPAYEKLTGDLKGAHSRRINIKHRLVYTIHEQEKTIKILSLWSHYAE